jgi:hypothetical protein
VRLQARLMLIAITAFSTGAWGQCTRPEVTPSWDAGTAQFKCVGPDGAKGSSSDEIVLPTGDKDHCNLARENLLKACPASNDGKVCREKAKSIFNACYKGSKRSDESRSGSASSTNQASKTEAAVCMNTFTQQQQFCQSRKLPPPSPGQPSAPDTCLQDALAAQKKCLANSR